MAQHEIERRSNIDRLLIRHARKSPREIEEATGIPANEAIARLNELLDSRDHLTLRRQEVLLVEEMNELFHESRDRMHNAGDRDFASITNAALRAATQMMQRLDAARKANVIDVDKITEGQARIFGKLFDVALNHILTELSKEYDIPKERIMELHREGMNKSQDYADQNLISEAD